MEKSIKSCVKLLTLVSFMSFVAPFTANASQKSVNFFVTDSDSDYASHEVSKVNKQKWTQEEDNILFDSVKSCGDKINWVIVASKVEGRSVRSCRERYRRLFGTGVWSTEEDDLLLRLVRELGKSWKNIHLHLVRHSETACKNRYLFLKRGNAEFINYDLEHSKEEQSRNIAPEPIFDIAYEEFNAELEKLNEDEFAMFKF